VLVINFLSKAIAVTMIVLLVGMVLLTYEIAKIWLESH
jgi:hypothetical protein